MESKKKKKKKRISVLLGQNILLTTDNSDSYTYTQYFKKCVEENEWTIVY